jgi:predicted Zn-dependent peptidase
VGANYNASTSEEVTLYYAAILPEYLDRVFELLATLMRPSLREDDFNVEKQVILEEIGMYEDMPTFACYERAMQTHFTGHPLGNSVLGSVDSITALTAEQMRQYHQQRYGGRNLLLAASGNFSWDELVRLAERHCSHWNPGTPGRMTEEALPQNISRWFPRAQLKQQHVIQMAPAPSSQSELRFAAELASSIVGDDSSGRLYWDLVETGLAETADLSYNDYDGSGAWMTYLCCSPEETKPNLQRIGDIFEEFNKTGPTQDEFDQARNKVASRIVLQSERPMGRLSSLGGNWLFRKEYRTVLQDLEHLQAMTLHDFRTLLDKYPLRQTSTVGLGPVEK